MPSPVPTKLKTIALIAFAIGALQLSLGAWAQDTAPQSTNELLQLGRQAYQAKQLDDALRYFRGVMERAPNNPEAPFRIGVILMQKNQFEEAVAMVSRSIELAPQNLGARFTLAAMYENAKAIDRAIDEYLTIILLAQTPQQKQKAQNRLDKLIAKRPKDDRVGAAKLEALVLEAQRRPDDVKIQLALAEAYLSSGQFSQAIAAYNHVLTLDAANANALIRLTELHKRAGRTEDALTTLEQLLTNIPKGPILEAATGLTLSLTADMRRQDPARALRFLEPLAKALPDDAAIQTNTGLLYHANGQPKEAETAYRKALAQDPENALIYANLAKLYLSGGRPDMASIMLDKVIRLDQDPKATRQAKRTLTDLLLKQGQAFLKQGKFKQAEKTYNRARELSADEADMLHQTALAYYDASQYPIAINYLEQAKALDPDDPRLDHYLALSLGEVNRYDAALEAWRSVAMRDDYDSVNMEEIASHMATLMAQKAFSEQRYDFAEQVFKYQTELSETDYTPYFHLALIYDQTSRKKEAIAHYEKVIEIEPGHIGARLQLGRIYEQEWQEEDALAQYNLVRSAGVGTAIAQEAERRLDSLNKRINGFSYSLTQAMTLDSNSNLSEDNPESDIRSELSYGLTYRNKLRHNLRLRVGFNSGYTAFVIGGSDLFSLSLSPSLTLGNAVRGLEAGATHREVFSFLTGADINVNNALYSEFRTRFDPSVILPNYTPQTTEAELWTLRGRLTYSDLESFTNSFLSSTSVTAQTFLVIRPKRGQALNLGYSLILRDNTEPEGSDYAYVAHSANVGWEKALRPRLTTSLRYGLTWTLYTNPDSFSPEGFKRRNLRHTLAASANYVIHRNVRLFGGYTFTLNSSNLPVRNTTTDLEVSLQSASLGDYQAHALTFGLGLTF